MRTPIKLDSTAFDLAAVVHALNTSVDLKVKDKMVKMPDFGSVIIGPAHTHPDVQWFIEESSATLFSAPVEWRMPHILKALGAFRSAGEAKRNGWDKDVPEGWSQHVCRVGHVRGAIHILKLTCECPRCKALMVSDVVHQECPE